MHRNIIILISVTVAVLALVVFGLSYFIDVKPALTAQEQKFAHFNYEKLNVADRKPLLLSGLRSPVQSAGPGPGNYPAESLSEIAPATASKGTQSALDKGKDKKQQGLSMVLMKDGGRVAIVDGAIVREGEMTKNGRVIMIKKDSILIKNNEGEKWLRME